MRAIAVRSAGLSVKSTGLLTDPEATSTAAVATTKPNTIFFVIVVSPFPRLHNRSLNLRILLSWQAGIEPAIVTVATTMSHSFHPTSFSLSWLILIQAPKGLAGPNVIDPLLSSACVMCA
jgi:hypothetical protein